MSCSSCLHRVGVLVAGVGSNGLQRLGDRRRRRRPPRAVGRAGSDGGVVGGALTRALAEDQQVAQRVAAEPVGAVHPAGDLADREQAGDRRRLGVGVDLDAAHHVVAGRARPPSAPS